MYWAVPAGGYRSVRYGPQIQERSHSLGIGRALDLQVRTRNDGRTWHCARRHREQTPRSSGQILAESFIVANTKVFVLDWPTHPTAELVSLEGRSRTLVK